MTIRAVSFLLPIVAAAAVVFAQRTASVDPEAAAAAAAGAVDAASDDGGGGGHATVQAQYVESRTTSITVNWTVNSTSSHHHDFQVLALSLNSGIVLVARPTNATVFTLTDLTVDTSYKICVVVVSAKDPQSSIVALAVGVLEEEEEEENNDPDGHHHHDRSCLVASTIKYVRLDSVLVFLAVVAFIALSIVAAVVCWKRSNAAAAAAGEDPGSEDDDGHGAAGASGGPDDDPEEEKKGSDEEQPLLDSDNNQYPPPPLPPTQQQKSSGDPVPEVRVESEVEPVIVVDADHQKSELPADGPADGPIPV